MFLGIISTVLKFFGFIDLAEQMLHDYEQRQQGRVAQAKDDAVAAVKVQQQQASASADSPKTQDELTEKLEKGEI